MINQGLCEYKNDVVLFIYKDNSHSAFYHTEEIPTYDKIKVTE